MKILAPSLIILFFSSLIINLYLINLPKTQSNPSNVCPEGPKHDILINCTEEAVATIINDWMMFFDQRFAEQQSNFSNGDFFPIVEYDNISKTELFNFNNLYSRHVSFSYPFVIRGGVKHWKALKRWQNNTYLLKKIGNRSIKVEKKPHGNNEFAYFKRDFRRSKMKYSHFLEKSENYEKEPFIFYWAEQSIPKALHKDFKEPRFGLLMNLEDTNIWQGSAGSISLPHTDGRDNLYCQVVGTKEFILIPPTQRQLLYVSDLTEEKKGLKPTNYSPVDFFKPDYKRFPEFGKVRGKMYVKLEPGDILFLPAFWWHHVKAAKGKNIAVNFWYTANFMTVNFMAGIDNQFHVSN